MEIIYQDEFIKLRKSDIVNCVEYIRKKNSSDLDTEKEMLNKLAFQIRDNVYYKVVIDVSKLDFVKDATREYLKNFCLSFLGSVGARVFAVVTGNDEKKKMQYQDLVTDFSEIINRWKLQYDFFNDIEEAKEWITHK